MNIINKARIISIKPIPNTFLWFLNIFFMFFAIDFANMLNNIPSINIIAENVNKIISIMFIIYFSLEDF